MKNLLYLTTLCLSIFPFYSEANTQSAGPVSEAVIEEICSSKDCYQLIRELGEGAFGKVYAATNSQGGIVAIKRYKVPPNFPASHLLGDAQREFEIGQTFDHPNVVKSVDLFDFVSNGDETKNLVLEFIDGHTVYQAKKGAYHKDQSLNAAIQLVHALHYALAFDRMHVDLHSGNVMLDNQANLKVIDLASFYSFDELFNYVAKEVKQESPSSSESDEIKTLGLSPTSPPAKDARLEQLFDQNPQLLEQLKKAQKDSPKKTETDTSIYHLGVVQETDLEAKYPGMSAFQAYYFDRITDICVRLILKSDLDREEKINLRVDIKKLAWSYQEDAEEGKKIPLSEYLNQLIQILQPT